MEDKKIKKTINYLCRLSISLILLFHSGPYIKQHAQAFFEDQVKYKLKHYWYPMLSDPSPEKRFQSARVFLTYPEWSLPLLRNSIMNLDPENVPWQIAMLIGMLGDSTDIPHLLKIWKDLGMYENSSIWLGAMRRLYWKSRGPDPRTPFLKRIEIKFAEDLAESEIYKKKLNLFFEVENPTNSPRFIRLSANFWHTITDENIPSKYFWIPAGGRIESNIKTHIYPSFHTENIRMDIKIWEIGVSKTINHHTEEISFPFK